MAKRVCVIGAGPSGLVAAKTFIHDTPGHFQVTVFEQSERIGGLWPISKVDDGLVNPNMCTNQSRHTVSFSDMAWPAGSPTFPKAWQVGQYLQRYISIYPGYQIRTGAKVLKADQVSPTSWEVHVQTKNSTEVLEYDHVVVTSGFFAKPKAIPPITTGPIRAVHSSNYRNLTSLLGSNLSTSNDEGLRKIVVVGGQMSGVEVAASIGFEISSGSLPYSVTHIIQRPLRIMPLFFANDPTIDVPTPSKADAKETNPAPIFLPLDLVAYNLAVRPPGPIENTSGHITETAAQLTNNYLGNHIGGDQSELGVSNLTISPEVAKHPPMLGISDDYKEFVRSGDISILKGRVTRQHQDSLDTIIVENEGEENVIKDVAAVVFATGFEVSPALDFLSQELLEKLQFDSSSDVFPLALNVHTAVSRQVPSLGFVGFYRSPYWGVMEMQSRFLAKLWSGDLGASKALDDDITMDSMLSLRKDPRCAQFPMGDYAYLMESFSDILGMGRFEPNDTSARTGIVFGPRYTFTNSSAVQKKETTLALESFYETFELSRSGGFVARAVSRALQGKWKLSRTITSYNSSYPSGTLSGTAKFKPRSPTSEDDDVEYLYMEEGDFATDNGLNFTAKRSYAYRYNEKKDKITAWFVKEDGSVDYFFHELQFSKAPNGWVATSNHWCTPDQYDVEYEFKFEGTSITEWSQKYKVKGPNKDYTLQSVFTR